MRVLLVGSGASFPLGTELACRLAASPEVSHVAIWSISGVRDPERLAASGIEVLYDPPSQSTVPGMKAFNKWAHVRRSLARLASMEFDVVSIQYLDVKLGLFAGVLRRIAPRLTVTLWGSDLLATTRRQRLIQRRILAKADVVTAASPDLLERARYAYGRAVKGRLQELRFGLTTLDSMRALNWEKSAARAELGLPLDGPIISLSYHGGEINRHLPVLRQLESLALPENTTLVVPLTYGGSLERRAHVREVAERSSLRCVVFQQYMTSERVAALRTAADVLIHVPTSDAFSGSMSEYLFAGNRVVTGSWLPFDWLADHGITLDLVDSLEETGEAVLRVLQELDEKPRGLEQVQAAIWRLVSWEQNLPNWIATLRG